MSVADRNDKILARASSLVRVSDILGEAVGLSMQCGVLRVIWKCYSIPKALEMNKTQESEP